MVLFDDVSSSLFPIIAYSIVGIISIVLLVLASRNYPRSKGRIIKYHIILLCVVIISTLFCPLQIKKIIFSELGITIIGMLFPIYESVRAICTPQVDDDMAWLQYWVSMSFIYFIGAYLGAYESISNSRIGLGYREFEFWYFLWLHLPFTDGSSLIYERLTLPFCIPWIKPTSANMNKMIKTAYQFMINVIHIAVVTLFFQILPHQFQRLVSIAVGTVYPLFESIIAVNTEEPDDDTYWLTYWCCFGTFFVIIDFIQEALGKVPGFYTVVILCTVYLMLPMFRGSERIFRNVLVPLAGLREMLIMRDALNVKKDIMANIPIDRRDAICEAIAKSFNNHGKDDDIEFLKETGAKTSSRSDKYNNTNNTTTTSARSATTTTTTGGGQSRYYSNDDNDCGCFGGGGGGGGSVEHNRSAVESPIPSETTPMV